MGDKCCRNGGDGGAGSADVKSSELPDIKYDPSQEPIFPPELKVLYNNILYA